MEQVMSDSDNDDKIKSDYEYSRDTYYELIEKGKQSLELMIEVARESEHPRAFEVLSNMIKGVADVNDKLMDLNKKNRDINQKSKSNPQGLPNVDTLNQQNIYVGSTTDLQRLLNKEKNPIDITPKE